MRPILSGLVAVAITVACKTSTPSATDVCTKLQTAGVAANCRPATPTMLNARASQMVDFDMPSVPGKGGHVLSFAKADDFDATVKAYEGVAMLAGPWRFGNAKARIFVQMNDGASPSVGQNARTIVDGL